MGKYVATIGFFDGVHRGHRCLIHQVCACAKEHGCASMLITFDRHPRQVLHSDFVPQLLSTLEEKTALLGQSDADELRVLPFTPELARLTARQFMADVLVGQLNVGTLVMGYDHRFGHGGGSFEEYVAWGREAGIEVILATALDDVAVSSSRIRRLLADGDVSLANELLGYPYAFEGEVIKGRQLGRTLGFPTANVAVPRDKMLPATGVYAVEAITQDGHRWGGMLCIGSRPTVQNGNDVSVEVNLFGFAGDLYGTSLRIEMVARLRDEVKYESLEQLKHQLGHDAEHAESILNRTR